MKVGVFLYMYSLYCALTMAKTFGRNVGKNFPKLITVSIYAGITTSNTCTQYILRIIIAVIPNDIMLVAKL